VSERNLGISKARWPGLEFAVAPQKTPQSYSEVVEPSTELSFYKR
jgi:hypothetical protein